MTSKKQPPDTRVTRVEGRIYIGGVPATEVAEMVKRHSLSYNKGKISREIVRCRRCKVDKPIFQFNTRNLSESRFGYTGTCDECYALQGAKDVGI
jgi:hypothetical protein